MDVKDKQAADINTTNLDIDSSLVTTTTTLTNKTNKTNNIDLEGEGRDDQSHKILPGQHRLGELLVTTRLVHRVAMMSAYTGP